MRVVLAAAEVVVVVDELSSSFRGLFQNFLPSHK